MVLKAANVRSCATVILVALLFCMTLLSQDKPQPQPTPAAFDAQAASRMLLQLSESLQGQSQKHFLELFDLSRMKDGALFRQQVSSFFSKTISIRVHMNLADTSFEGDKAALSVDAQMEAEPAAGGAITRRNERLTFAVALVGDKWKFVEVQPRSFFSLE
jgi:hypothetical protein